MRKKRNNQTEFIFQPATQKITAEYYERFDRISDLLDNNPEILDRVHTDLKKVMKSTRRDGPGRNSTFTSENVLRTLICQTMERKSVRGIVIRIDADPFLRKFVRIYSGPMMSFPTYSTQKNAIQPKTWKKINQILTKAAVENGSISGERLRLDTTAYETNVRWPTDSGLLWDTYRVVARLVNTAREIDPEAAADKRLQAKRAKKLHTTISRRSGKKGEVSKAAKASYKPLIGLVEEILEWAPTVSKRLRQGLDKEAYGFMDSIVVEGVIDQLHHFRSLGLKVVDQARRRVLQGEKVPNEEKIFSIFEPHTELLKRGKAGKPIEFGHMIALQQVESKFITDYEVFERKPVDYTLVEPALESHRRVFGENPIEFSADKGFYEDMERVKELETEIDVVSICKKGKRNAEEEEREAKEAFKLGQRFRAGIEGTISVLKRALGMFRCRNKGWEHYVSTVGATVFTHNLLILARG